MTNSEVVAEALYHRCSNIISDLEFQFAALSPTEPVFDFKENAATPWVDEFDDHIGERHSTGDHQERL